VVTHQLQVERGTGKVRRPETNVLPLCHATNLKSAGTMRYSSGSFVDFSQLPITETSRMVQHCGPTAAVAVISRNLTFAPRTPATSPENNRCVHLSLVCPRQGLVTGACVKERCKFPVPAPTTADVQSLHHDLCVNRHTRPSALVGWGRHAVAAAASILPTCCPQPITLSHARHLICKCVTSTFLKV